MCSRFVHADWRDGCTRVAPAQALLNACTAQPHMTVGGGQQAAVAATAAAAAVASALAPGGERYAAAHRRNLMLCKQLQVGWSAICHCHFWESLH